MTILDKELSDSAIGKIKNGETITIKVNWGKYKVPLTIKRDWERLWLSYPLNKSLTTELKACLSGMTWHGFKDPPIKKWSCTFNEHTVFQLEHLAGLKPYARYDAEPTAFEPYYPLKAHQIEGVASNLTTRRSIFGYEMGLGKTLMVFEIAKHLKPNYILWVSTKSALLSVQLQVVDWKFDIPIRFMTYDGVKRYLSQIESGEQPPVMIVGDESHKLKNIMSQRTQCFNYLTQCMRIEHRENCNIILMTGTPAPKSPIDWYSQCEIVQPGFLREGNIHVFKDRLGITKVKENTLTGGVYPELLTWRDDSNKCHVCGQYADAFEHDDVNLDRHDFVQGVNEVAKLYKRMKGLVLVKTKKECTDLPDKIYQRIHCKPSMKTQQLMKLIAATTSSAAKALTLLRELSDGFQYTTEQEGTDTCSTCNGSGRYVYPRYNGPEKTLGFIKTLYPSWPDEADPEDCIIDPSEHPQLFEMSEEQACPTCEGLGQVKRYIKATKQLKTAKDQALIDILDEHDDVGRLVVYAGFTGTLQRICELVQKQKWDFIKLDGSGFSSSLAGTKEQLLTEFQKGQHRRLVFIGNPGAASTGLTLTASPTVVFYSNSFNSDDRIQAEDRIHRIGMDANRGARIIDLIHLPTDIYVLDNLQKKKNLQDMSMGLILEYTNKESERYDYE